MTLPPSSDRELQLRLRRGDGEALRLLFERHRGSVFALCCRLAGDAPAEDLLQETFLRAWRYRRSLRGRARFATWLYSVARNVCRDHLRARRRESERIDGASVDQVPARDPSPLRRTVDRDALRSAIDALAPDAREVLVLSRFHGLSYREIGEVCGCSEGAVKLRIHRAITRLRATRSENEEDAREL